MKIILARIQTLIGTLTFQTALSAVSKMTGAPHNLDTQCCAVILGSEDPKAISHRERVH